MERRVCKVCGCEKSLNQFANAGKVNGINYKRHLCIPCYSLSKQPRKDRIKEEYIEWKKKDIIDAWFAKKQKIISINELKQFILQLPLTMELFDDEFMSINSAIDMYCSSICIG